MIRDNETHDRLIAGFDEKIYSIGIFDRHK